MADGEAFWTYFTAQSVMGVLLGRACMEEVSFLRLFGAR
jgi:hypothetical protein